MSKLWKVLNGIILIGTFLLLSASVAQLEYQKGYIEGKLRGINETSSMYLDVFNFHNISVVANTTKCRIPIVVNMGSGMCMGGWQPNNDGTNTNNCIIGYRYNEEECGKYE